MAGSLVKHSLMGLNLHFSVKYQPFKATISRQRRCCGNDGDFRSKKTPSEGAVKMKGGPFATGAFQKNPDAPISLRANQGPRGVFGESVV